MKNPFIRKGDENYDLLMAEKFFILLNINKLWKTSSDREFDTVITYVIFRGERPWERMDIRVKNKEREFQTVIGEFLEHYFPENGEMFDANKLFTKKEIFYGSEYTYEIRN